MTETAAQLIARIGCQDQRITYTVTPMPDSLLPAESLGGQLTALADLFAVLGRQDGVKLKTMVESISTDGAGAISFTLLVVPLEVGKDAAA